MPLGTQLVEKAGSLTCRPSKIKALLSSLKTLIQENPTQKVVIFSQVSPSRYYCSFAIIADFFLSSLSTRVFASSAALGAVRCHHLTTPPLAMLNASRNSVHQQPEAHRQGFGRVGNRLQVDHEWHGESGEG